MAVTKIKPVKVWLISVLDYILIPQRQMKKFWCLSHPLFLFHYKMKYAIMTLVLRRGHGMQNKEGLLCTKELTILNA